jgi:hypothetical protein
MMCPFTVQAWGPERSTHKGDDHARRQYQESTQGLPRKLQRPIELVASLDDSAKAQELPGLLADIAELSDKVALRTTHARCAVLRRAEPGEAPRIHFAGIPMGHEFTSLVLALLQTGGHPPKVDAAVIDRSRPCRALRVRDLHLPVLPQLPGRGAGPQPDGRAQPRRDQHDDRRRAVPGPGQ